MVGGISHIGGLHCFFHGVFKETVPYIGRTCANETKIRGILRGLKFISCLVVRDKKNCERRDFCSQTPARMVDPSSLVLRRGRRDKKGCGYIGGGYNVG